MFSASRFSTIPTRTCRRRLEAALSNRKPISKGERNRPAVIALQSALADLNRGYLLSAEVDGYFGVRTYAGVEAFQRDYGLVADGQVGRQTLSQLDELYSGDVIREPIGISVHIGVDRLEPGHYGTFSPLQSCANDARKMRQIAESIGYDAITFLNEEATIANFTGFMRNAIENLFSGDSLLVTFSGHGSRIPNTSIDAEDDNLDETLCFYDRMLIDDELYAMLEKFREGVRVNLVFDSCHSGTVAKTIALVEEERDEYMNKSLTALKDLSVTVPDGKVIDEVLTEKELALMPLKGNSLTKALAGEKPEYAKLVQPKEDHSRELANLFADLEVATNKGQAKSMLFFNRIYNKNQQLYDAIRDVLGPKEEKQLLCAAVSFSACQDSQTTLAGNILSLFTSNIDMTWNDGYEGSAREFHRLIVNNTNRPSIVPAINTYGGSRARMRLYERPFYI